MNRYSNVMVRKILGNFGVRLMSAIINLMIAIVVSQYLGATGKGEQSIVLTMIAIVTIFDNMVGGASIVFLTNKLPIRELFFVSYIWTIFVSLLSYVVLITLNLVPSQFTLSVVLLSAISSVISIHSSVLLGKEKLRSFNLLSFLVPLLTLLMLLVQFAWNLNRTASAYVNALYFAYLLTGIVSVLLVAKSVRKDATFQLLNTWKSFQSLIYYGFQNQLAHVFQLLSFRMSYFFLEKNCGEAQVGIYSNAVSVIESVWMISTSISLWQYAKIANSTDVHYTKKITEQLTKYGLLVAFFALMCVVLIPAGFYSWLFGKDFRGLNELMWFLAPGIWVFNYALILGHYFSGHGKYYVNAFASGVGLIVTCIASYFLIPTYQTTGAAISASLSYLVTSIVVIVFFRKEGAKFVVFPSIQELKETLSLLKVSTKSGANS
ncbi:MAG: polysaccharide biosynthesis C-terminal domain-containing protein [Flavobacteriales bacterium]